MYDIYDADEAFMTGTPFCMLPVTSINNIPINERNVGNIFSKLIKQWSTNTNVNIVKQIKEWNAETNTQSTAPTPYSFKK